MASRNAHTSRGREVCGATGQREETVAWANANGCMGIIEKIPQEDFYFVDEPSSDAIGPGYGPMHRDWDFSEKSRPHSEESALHFERLSSQWQEIVGPELGPLTRPLGFTGAKFRRLLVVANGSGSPPWGGWSYLSSDETQRRTFTRFRASINRAIAPHLVDHIDFTTSIEP